jgi:hypothetical protein
MSAVGAGAALQAAAFEALGLIDGLGAYASAPLQAAVPYALVESGPESDWSHKSGDGRELRLAVTIRDRGETPVRLAQIAVQVEIAMDALDVPAPWRLVSFRFVRNRLMPPRKGSPDADWAAVIEWRARMLREN